MKNINKIASKFMNQIKNQFKMCDKTILEIEMKKKKN